MKKKLKKNNYNNQTSFYFEDYLETNKQNKTLKNSTKFQDRIYLLFLVKNWHRLPERYRQSSRSLLIPPLHG